MARSNEPTGWVGWIYFASAVMLVMGGLQAISGLVAIFKNDFYVATQNGLVAFNYTTWGWIDLVLGVVVFCAGLALMNGSAWARVVAVFLTVLSALANFAFLPAYPIWSIIGLVVDGLVLYALTVHGGELRD
ncbi:MAG TPA: hypothetical protein VMT23_00615 [Candidatus Binatia bacterium]|nr:hypothetical protein [Candidatus Binatia bacterium]